MQTLWDRVLSATLTVAAIAIAGVLVHREFFASPSAKTTVPSGYVKNWRSILPASHTFGNPDAPIAIVEFSDLECPFCKRFHSTLREVQRKHPNSIKYSFVHFPLVPHAHALRAARAAECANEFGKFEEALDAMFANQDSLGNRDWSWLSRSLEIQSSLSFERCASDTTTPPIVRAGLAIGSELNVAGTPTVFLNGWRFAGMPSDTEINRAVEDLLSGKTPYKKFPSNAINAR